MKVLHKVVAHGENEAGLRKEPKVPALPTNLVRIGATYKFRSRIPQDLLSYYQPKREITESLHSKSLAEAKRLLPTIQLKYQQLWANLRAAIGVDVSELPLNDATIQYLTTCFEHESLGGDDRTRLEDNYTVEEIQDYRERLTESIAFLRDAAAVGDLEVIQPALEQYLHLKKIKVTGTEADHRRLALAYLRGAIQTNSALLARMQGESIATPTVKAIAAGLSATPLPHRPTESAGITLHALFEYWRDAVTGRPARTVEDFERRVKQIDELTGHKPADQLVKADFVNFRDAMLAKGKATTTVEKDLSFLKTIMRYAHKSDKIPQNPTDGIKVSQRKVSQSPQRALDMSDVTTLFNSPIYTKHERPHGGGRDAAAWVPLLSLYAGARLEELCQLRVDDIQQQDEIHFMRIIDLDDEAAGIHTNVKTDESRRRVPIHPVLIEAGFLAYVAYIKAQEQDWLFPHLNPDRYGKRGGNWSKWWARWRTTLGVCGRQKCYHAFRHNFKSACRDSEIGEDLHDALTGHNGGGVGRDYGTFSLKALDTAMRKLRHPGLTFTWVWQPSTERWAQTTRPVRRSKVSAGGVERR